MDRVDVWLVRFCPGSDDPVEALRRVFGISEPLAREIEQTTPRIIKHGATKEVADQMVAALEGIGAEVSCRPSRAAQPSSTTDAGEQASPASPPASASEEAAGARPSPGPITFRPPSDSLRPEASPVGASEKAAGSRGPEPAADLAAERAARQASVPVMPVVSARSPQAARVTRRVSLPSMAAAVSNREATAAASTGQERQASDDDPRSASLPRRLRPAIIVGLPGGLDVPSAPADDEPSSPPHGPPPAKPASSGSNKKTPPPAKPASSGAKKKPRPAKPASSGAKKKPPPPAAKPSSSGAKKKPPPPPAKPSSSGAKKKPPPPAKPSSSGAKKKPPPPAKPSSSRAKKKPASRRRKGQAGSLKKRRDRSGPRRPSGGD